MSKKLVFALFVVLVVALVGCSLPSVTNAAGAGTTTAKAKGTVKFTVPHLAPWVLASELKSHIKVPVKRAFVEADEVDYLIYYSPGGGQVGSTIVDTPGSNLDYYDDTTADTNTQTLSPGNYSVTVNILNYNVSTTTPVVSGTSTFTVTSGGSTSVTVTCFPTSPVALDTSGVSSSYYTFIPAYEQWFYIPPNTESNILLHVDVTDTLSATNEVDYYVFYASADGNSSGNDGLYTGGNGWTGWLDGTEYSGTEGDVVAPPSGTGYWVALFEYGDTGTGCTADLTWTTTGESVTFTVQ
jgi:hypothetical protein